MNYDEVLQKIVENEELAKVKDLVEQTSSKVFRYAVLFGRSDVVEYLVENGLDFRMNDNEAMRHAVANGHLDIVKYLVKKGVDPRLDKNLMVYATEWGRQAVVSYLKSLGC